VRASNIVLKALKEAIKVIKELKVDYCLFGGLAIAAYKRIRATMDVDLMVDISEKQFADFISGLEKRGFKFDHKKGIIKIGNFEILRFIYTDKESQIDVFVDCVNIKTEFQKEVLSRKQNLDILGTRVNIASCEDLILLKILAARPLDKVDAQVLIAENVKDIDRNYLKKWARELGVERRLQHMLPDRVRMDRKSS